MSCQFDMHLFSQDLAGRIRKLEAIVIEADFKRCVSPVFTFRQIEGDILASR